jgi:hypothetical protein
MHSRNLLSQRSGNSGPSIICMLNRLGAGTLQLCGFAAHLHAFFKLV